MLVVAGSSRRAVAGQAARFARRTVAARLIAKTLQRKAMSAAISQPINALSSTALSGLGIPRPLAFGAVSLVAKQLAGNHVRLPKLELPPHSNWLHWPFFNDDVIVVDVPTTFQLTAGSPSAAGGLARWLSLLLLVLAALAMFYEGVRRKLGSHSGAWKPRAAANAAEARIVLETPSQAATMHPPVKSADKSSQASGGTYLSKAAALMNRSKSESDHHVH